MTVPIRVSQALSHLASAHLTPVPQPPRNEAGRIMGVQDLAA